jgi:hypothetical protein
LDNSVLKGHLLLLHLNSLHRLLGFWKLFFSNSK